MRKTDRFEEITKSLRDNPIFLPVDIKMQKTMTPEGHFAYVFRHQRLGELGRMIIVPHSSGQTQWVSEIVGDPDDPMTRKRKEVLVPILQNLYRRADEIFGTATGQLKTYNSHSERHLIKSMVMPCEKCNAPTAMLIMANADTDDQLEDYARLMFSQVKELDIPTWVVGYEKEVCVNGEKCGESLVLKIWPTREEARIMLSTELNPILDELMDTHCL